MEICHRLLTYSMYKEWRKAPPSFDIFLLGGALHRLFGIAFIFIDDIIKIKRKCIFNGFKFI